MPLSNPNSVTVTPVTSATSTPTNVGSSATSVTILASNTNRKGGIIWNLSTANLYIEFGTTSTVTAFTAKLFSGGYYEVPFGYTGTISGIWDAVNGSALVRELT